MPVFFAIFLPWIASYGSVRSFNVLSLFAIYNESSGSLNLKNYDTERDKLVLQTFVHKHKQRMEGRCWCYYSSRILPNIWLGYSYFDKFVGFNME